MKSFTCERCGGTFDTDTPEFIKVAEAERNFGKLPEADDRASLCDDCYKWFMEIYNTLTPEEKKRIEEENK